MPLGGAILDGFHHVLGAEALGGGEVGDDLLAHSLAALACPLVAQLAIGHARDLDVEVDAVEQRPADPRDVVVDLVGGASALAGRVGVVAARAPVWSEFKKILALPPSCCRRPVSPDSFDPFVREDLVHAHVATIQEENARTERLLVSLSLGRARLLDLLSHCDIPKKIAMGAR